MAALENGVSQLPKQEGRFPQVSGVHFTYDVSRPAGSRVVSATIRGKPLDLDRQYTLATKPYLTEGKDGCTLTFNQHRCCHSLTSLF
jgi:5'-nucleotidase